jgi:hypothetical protein
MLWYRVLFELGGESRETIVHAISPAAARMKVEAEYKQAIILSILPSKRGAAGATSAGAGVADQPDDFG